MSHINRVIVVLANGTRKEFYDKEFFYRRVTIEYYGDDDGKPVKDSLVITPEVIEAD